MLQRARRPVASLCIALLAMNLVDCHTVTKKEAAAVIPRPDSSRTENIVGVTLKDGSEIKFDDKPRATYDADTLRAYAGKQPQAIPVSNLQRVWVKTTDKGRTTLLVLGLSVGAFATLLAIAIASKESCPFVYSWDGTQFVFDGEPYGGAVSRGLERDDYSNLEHLRADASGLYRLMVTNEVNETQYTNSMELVVIDHNPGARFEMDEWGRPYNVFSSIAPVSARDRSGRDLVQWLKTPDQLIWEPMPETDSTAPVREEIVLTYPKPRAATRARLVARAGTGLWGSHMIREMLQLRGADVKAWYAMVDNGGAPRSLLRDWNVREELYVLKLDVDEAGTWHTRGLLPGGGPFLTETRVVPLDLSQVAGDSLRLRIRPPAGFWALNSFEISYEDGDAPLAVSKVAPASARTSDDRDILADLREADDRYYAMPTTDDRAFVSFVAPPVRPGSERTIFLHTRGYYRLHLPEQGAADAVALRRITDVPDAAARMAAESFAKRRMASTKGAGSN
ncbi:MAG TPA: hypothetical protein VIM21_00360 [Gemmatimonadaceae bacterium]